MPYVILEMPYFIENNKQYRICYHSLNFLFHFNIGYFGIVRKIEGNVMCTSIN